MVAFGYEEPTRQNANRFTDLLSLGDLTALVSFADPNPGVTPAVDRAKVEAALTLLNDPADMIPIRAAIDAIAFGGMTPIGAGLQAAAGQLAGSTAPRAVLLISDGYNNVPPGVPTALASLPPWLRVYTVALGPAADASLLQGIALSTGGLFLPSPTVLELHQAYNDMRASITDEGLVANDVLDAERADRWVEVEPAADRLVVSVSAVAAEMHQVMVLGPSGRAVRRDDWGVSQTLGGGYLNFAIDRPPPGRWCVRIASRTPVVVGAFVTSPLRFDVELPEVLKLGEQARLRIGARFEDRLLVEPQLVVRSRALPLVPMPRDLDPDRRPEQVRKWMTTLKDEPQREVVWDTSAADLRAGWSLVTAELRGKLPGGSPYTRLIRRAVQVIA
jgi:hypothetical protein